MKAFFTFSFLFLNLIVSEAQDINKGNWRGVIVYDQVEVPFTFNVGLDDTGQTLISLINGQESIIINNTHWCEDSLVIPMHAFDAEIVARVSGNTMAGRWIKHYKSSPGRPFRAEFNKARFTMASNKPVSVPKKLKMTMSPNYGTQYAAVGLFDQKKNQITGTVLAEVGDFRYFEGIVKGDSIKMTSFDGVHCLFLKAKYANDAWTGELVLDNNYAESWTGVDDPDFNLADPFVELDPSEYENLEPYFDILTAGSGFNSLIGDDYFGKVTIIQVLGSWCPNSLDETRYLTQWYEENSDRDIDVLAVFYEFNYSKEYGMQRINDYVAHNNIPYATALGGPANKGQAALAFPFVNKLQAFPTLMILDKSGQARYMHTYFQGPATGDYYKDFDRRFREIVDGLLKE